MPNYAVVAGIGGVVTNTVVGNDKESVEAVVGSVVEMTEETGPAGIGWTWNGTTFDPPTPPVIEEESPV